MPETPQSKENIIEKLGKSREQEIQTLLKGLKDAENRQEWELVVKLGEELLPRLPEKSQTREIVLQKIQHAEEVKNVAW